MTLKDIAKIAGVSAVTVSNVINGNYSKVSRATVERVQRIIREYDYRPSATARSLAMNESRIIGVVIPNIAEDRVFTENPYYSYILSSLENYVRKQGYYLMLRSVERSAEIIPIFTTWNVDGIIMLTAYGEEVRDIQAGLNVPVVYIDTYTEFENIASIGVDDHKGGLLAVRYLLSLGHRDIALAGPELTSGCPGVIQERLNGAAEAFRDYGLEISEEQLFSADTNYEAGVEVGKRIAFAKRRFTAIFAMSDLMALGVMEGLRRSGLTVPGDVSVVGFDDLPLFCRLAYPPLTTVSQHIEQKALMAGEALFRMIRSKDPLVTREKVDVEIIERQSVRKIDREVSK